ncbi:two-component system sensor histidine kinase NtrB [Pseudodesulfovibrio sp.]|uniref:two-component system sensor histidine kinase NtrB n=1 Tax=unclassified Pseudodesulfovibrio TaxID=2661612 RepID=UPI003AFF827F
MVSNATTLEDLIGIEHSKLNFFQELRQSVDKLKASHRESEDQRLEIAAILEGITDVMMVLSENLEIISVNHVFQELFPGINPIGRYCYQVFRNTNYPCNECPAFRSLSTDAVCRETAIFRIGGRNRQFDMVAAPLKNPHLPQHRVLIFKRDVTMEKEYQAKFYQAEKMATIGTLAAGVAHEVNNPLTAVSGFAEGLKRRLPKLEGAVDQELYDDFEEYTDTIIKECARCQKIVQTLLTFSRPMMAAFTGVNVNRVVEDTIRILQHHFKSHPKLKVSLSLEETLPTIYGDEAQLKQVALNLLTNAVDAIGEEGELCVSTTSHGDGVRMSVSDTGCGIPAKNLDMLFEPFFTTKPVGKGIGIGLATCYHIVQEHGGEISVNSELGTGTCFSVILPIGKRGLHG